MKILSNKQYKALDREEAEKFLLDYLEELLQRSIKKTQASDNYKLTAWACYQAEQIGVQKTINKLLTILR